MRPIALMFLAGCSSYLMTPPRTFETEQRASVAIVTPCSAGSGVKLDNHTVLTALHVVSACELAMVRIYTDSAEHEATPEAAMAVDIARLHVEDNLAAAAVQIDQAEVGERLCGYTAIPSRHWLCGHVTAVSAGGSGVRLDTAVEHGNSGTGLYNSRGHLGAVVTQIDDAGGSRATQIPAWFAK